jgi:hypothetical protein
MLVVAVLSRNLLIAYPTPAIEAMMAAVEPAKPAEGAM